MAYAKEFSILLIMVSLFLTAGCLNQDRPSTSLTNQNSTVQSDTISTSPSFVINIETTPSSTSNSDKQRKHSQPINAPFLARGDELVIHDNLTDHLEYIHIWIVGDNYLEMDNITTDSHGSFIYTIDNLPSYNLPLGNMYIIEQSPGNNRHFEVNYNPKTGIVSEIDSSGFDRKDQLFNIKKISENNAAEAADLLRGVFNQPPFPTDDMYRISNITVEEPYIAVNPIGAHKVGDIISANGSTNIKTDSVMLVQIIQEKGISEVPIMKGNWSTRTVTIPVKSGNSSSNKWEYIFNSSGMNPDTYYLFVTGITVYSNASTSFSLNPVN